ncbi:MAG: hypothetical protein ACRDTC_28595 [Pseudonocardiaceae bacterium]
MRKRPESKAARGLETRRIVYGNRRRPGAVVDFTGAEQESRAHWAWGPDTPGMGTGHAGISRCSACRRVR